MPYSVEILGDRFRIATRDDLDRNSDIFADFSEHIKTDELVNFRKKLSHDDAMERFKDFDFTCIDFRLLEYLRNLYGLEHTCLLILYGICDDTIPCHELNDGEKKYVPYWTEDDEIDPRIQRLIEIEEDVTKFYEAKSISLKRKAKGGGNGRAAKKALKTTAKKPKQKDRTADDISQDPQESLRERPDSTTRSLPMPTDIVERDQDDEEPVKPEPVLADPDGSSGMPAAGGETKKKIVLQNDQSASSSREAVEIASDSDEPPHDKPPTSRGKTKLGGNATNVLDGNATKGPNPNTALDNREGITKAKTGLGSAQESASINAEKSAATDLNVKDIDNQVLQRPTSTEVSRTPVETTARAEPEHTTQPMVTDQNVPQLPKASHLATSIMAERIAIKQSKLDIKRLQFELDYEDGDQAKRRRRLDMAVSELEILQMQYEMQHGEVYDG